MEGRTRREALRVPCGGCGTLLRRAREAAKQTRCATCGVWTRLPRAAFGVPPELRLRSPLRRELSCPFLCSEHLADLRGRCPHSSSSRRLSAELDAALPAWPRPALSFASLVLGLTLCALLALAL